MEMRRPRKTARQAVRFITDGVSGFNHYYFDIVMTRGTLNNGISNMAVTQIRRSKTSKAEYQRIVAEPTIAAEEVDAVISTLRFFIVDDRNFWRNLLRTTLRGYGIKRVDDCRCPAQALKRMTKEQFDFVLIGYEMPLMNGIEFTRMVRRGHEVTDNRVPIIMVSVYADAEHVMEARAVGVNEYLVKPFSADRLYSRIRSIVQYPRPFLVTKHYVGPDRRWAVRDDGDNAEIR